MVRKGGRRGEDGGGRTGEDGQGGWDRGEKVWSERGGLDKGVAHLKITVVDVHSCVCGC